MRYMYVVHGKLKSQVRSKRSSVFWGQQKASALAIGLCAFFGNDGALAQEAQVSAPKTAPIAASASDTANGAAHQTLPIDCGENSTTIERQVKNPMRMEVVDPTKADWAEYERRVLEQFNTDGASKQKTAPPEPETITETTEGCALDEWDAERMAPGLDPENEIVVTYTGKVTNRTQEGQGTENQSESAGGRNQKAGETLPSAKDISLMKSIEDFLQSAVFRYGLVAVLGIALVLVSKTLFQLALGFFFRRRNCRIEAVLLTINDEFPGTILILGKLGCRFAADDFGKIDRLLDTPDFVDFSISIGGNVRPVFINRAHGAAFAAFFVDPLKRKEQAEILQLSTIKPQFASWKPAKNGGRGGVKTVRARLARLQEMREEELARKATS
jgi:hypothetical protein